MALYNNGFPTTYQPVYYQPQYQPMPQSAPAQQPQTQSTGGVIWVQGEPGMKAYLVAPNTTVQLWDSEKNTIYLKSADASGMPSVKILDYTIRDSVQPQAPAVRADAGHQAENYATKEDIASLNDQIASLRQEIDGLTIRKTPARRKEQDDE